LKKPRKPISPQEIAIGYKMIFQKRGSFKVDNIQMQIPDKTKKISVAKIKAVLLFILSPPFYYK
jgi:hypothetical protein